jgi:hypothetical protein
MHRSSWTVIAVLAAATFVRADSDAAKPAKPKTVNEVEVRFTDGSRVRMTILQERLEVVTKYGPLSIPTGDIRRIEFGIHPTEAVRKRMTDAIGRLGSASFKERERGTNELMAIGAPAYIMLHQAMKDRDPEVAHRARVALDEIRKKVPEEQLRVREDDQVQTADFTVVGRVTAPTIRASTAIFGEAQLKVTDLRSVRWMGGQAELELSIDGAKYANNNAWLDTGITLSLDDDINITASGQIDLMTNGTGQYVTGPAGTHQWGMGRGGAAHPPGALLGRIGENGQPFLVGESYRTLCKKEGKLYLQIAPSPWINNGAPVTGAYKVTIAGGRDTMDRQP